ncbi:MAG TPA: hypothetical protein VK866_11380 [Acidimicrobiales bacterium]|nr:hypothetical protein [Acidimicrobiales bacterium]
MSPAEPDDEWVPTGKWASPAIYASNWRRILVIDASLGAVAFVAGVVLMVRWNVVGGAFVASLGLTYVVAVGRRALQWRWLRRRAGLDGGLPDES